MHTLHSWLTEQCTCSASWVHRAIHPVCIPGSQSSTHALHLWFTGQYACFASLVHRPVHTVCIPGSQTSMHTLHPCEKFDYLTSFSGFHLCRHGCDCLNLNLVFDWWWHWHSRLHFTSMIRLTDWHLPRSMHVMPLPRSVHAGNASEVRVVLSVQCLINSGKFWNNSQ
jgi:hypothetical protein